MDNPINPNALPTWRQALAHTQKVLSQMAAAPTHEAAWLLQHLLGVDDKTQFIREGEHRTLSAREFDDWHQALMRRQAGVPLAYLLGSAPFMGEMFQVDENVLIPRADTETLVQWVVQVAQQQWQKTAQPLAILELGVGSGAPLCMVGKRLIAHLPQTAFTLMGCDRSAAALQVAAHNLAKHHVHAQLFESDWLAALPDRSPQQTFSLIYSNPPYIDAADPALGDDGVCAEPKMALIAADSGFADLRHIICAALPWLRGGGALALEHGSTQGWSCRTAMQQSGYQSIETLRDEGGRDRVTVGFCPS